MTFMAQADATWISPWMLVLSWILSNAVAAAFVIKTVQGKAEKREVVINPKPVSEVEFKRHERNDLEALAKIEHALDQLNNDRKGDVREIHRRIDRVDREVAATGKAQELQGQRLVQIDSKLDRLIERKTA